MSEPQPRPLLIAGLAAASLALGAVGWLARDLGAAAGRPSLLDFLDLAPASGRPLPGARPAPRPPSAMAWASPLQPSCPAPEPQLRQRLLPLVQRLRDSPERVTIDPSNYGERYRHDAYGNPLDTRPRLVVLHETVYGIDSALNTFSTPHPRDEDQVSYHAVIGLNGAVKHLLDPRQRAFGAGNSAFRGEWAITNPAVGGSVNNFALHVSLETPVDGEHDGPSHSGYTQPQYDALAALLALWMSRYEIAVDRITTHQAVDLGGERADPRSFDWRQLQRRFQSLGMLCERPQRG